MTCNIFLAADPTDLHHRPDCASSEQCVGQDECLQSKFPIGTSELCSSAQHVLGWAVFHYCWVCGWSSQEPILCLIC